MVLFWGFPNWYFFEVSRKTSKKYHFGTLLRFPQLVFFWGFPAGNKGVFRTTSDRGRIFCGLWIPHGNSKFSALLQNRRLLPLSKLSVYLVFTKLFTWWKTCFFGKWSKVESCEGSLLSWFVYNCTTCTQQIWDRNSCDMS